MQKLEAIQELEIKVDQTPSRITFNYEEVRDALRERMQVYQEIEVTETNLPERRRDIATLRRIAKAVEDRRREVKAAFQQPYLDFEVKTKELVAIIQQPIELLDRQVKEYEELQKEEKRKKAQEYFASAAAGTGLRFEQVFRKEWLNVSTSFKSICNEINERVRSYRADIDAIRAFGSETEEDALTVYHRTGQLSDAVRIIHEYEAQKKKILEAQERRRREAEAQAAREAAECEAREEKRRAEQAAREREEQERRIRAEEQARMQEPARAEEAAGIQGQTGAQEKAGRTQREQDRPTAGGNKSSASEELAFPGTEETAEPGSIAFPAPEAFAPKASGKAAGAGEEPELPFPAGPDGTEEQIAYFVTAAPWQHRALEAFLTGQRIRYQKDRR